LIIVFDFIYHVCRHQIFPLRKLYGNYENIICLFHITTHTCTMGPLTNNPVLMLTVGIFQHKYIVFIAMLCTM